MSQYHDDDVDNEESPEYIRRKFTNAGGPSRSFAAQEREQRYNEMLAMRRTVARRFSEGCTILLPDGRRITFLNIVPGLSSVSTIVRYHDSKVRNRNGKMSALRMAVPAFLRMVGDAEAEE